MKYTLNIINFSILALIKVNNVSTQVGDIPLPVDEELEYHGILSQMADVYSSSEVCIDRHKCLPLSPDLENIMANSNRYSLRTYVWKVRRLLTPYWNVIFFTINDLTKTLCYFYNTPLNNQKWRDVVGKTLKPEYERYVDLINKRAVLNGYDDAGDKWRSRQARNHTLKTNVIKRIIT